MSTELALVFRDVPEAVYALYGKLLFLDSCNGSFSLKDVTDGLRKGNKEHIYAFILALKKTGIIEVIEESFNNENIIYRLIDRERLSKIVYEIQVIIDNLDDLEDRLLPDNKYVLTGNVPEDFRDSKKIALSELLPIHSTLRDMISRAAEDVVILNPFFDKFAVKELQDVIISAVNRSVAVKIITRYISGTRRSNLEALHPIIEGVGRCERSAYFTIYQYQSEEKKEGRLLDFHAKMVISDRNKEAYLGSANLTETGLRSRLELGTKITGRYVTTLYELVNYLIRQGYIEKIDIWSGR